MSKKDKPIMGDKAASVDNPPDTVLPPHVLRAREHTGREARGRIDDAAERAAAGEESDIIDIVKSELGSGAYVRLHRKKITDTNFALIEPRIPLESFSTDWVMNTFGGGSYRGEFRRSDNTFVRNHVFEIDHSIPSTHPRERAAAAAPAAPDIAAIIAEVRRNNNGGGAESQLIPLLIASQQENTKMFVAMLQTIGAKQAGGGDSEIMALLAKSALTKKETPIDELLRGVHALERYKKGDAPELADDDDGEPPSLMQKLFGKDWIEKLVPVLTPIVQNIVGQVNGTPGGAMQARQVIPTAPPVTSGTAATPTPTNPPAATATAPVESEEAMFLRMYAAQIRTAAIRAAQEKKDPFEFVQGVAALVPASALPTIFAIVNGDDWFLKIFGGDSESARHVEFLTQVRNAVLYLALGTTAAEAMTNGAAPEVFAKEFLQWASASFKKDLDDALGDPDWFASNFRAGDDKAKKWIDGLRAAFEKQLDDAAPASAPAKAK